MGYDMYVVDEDGYNFPSDMGFDERKSQHLYWCRNIGGADRQVGRLVSAGIGYWSADETAGRKEWPEWCDCFGEDDHDRHIKGCAIRDHLRYTGDERPGIAVYKLCTSNDGWWVTKVECESALKLWESLGKPDVDDGLGDTIPFLQQAAKHHGFRVW